MNARNAPGAHQGAEHTAHTEQPASELRVFALDRLPEIVPGDDLAAMIVALGRGHLRDGDILAVTSKIVSKAEGRVMQADDREDAITAETVRVVATRMPSTSGGLITRIVENRLGLVMAAAGVDASNTAEGTVLLLPSDPDASARRIRAALREQLGLDAGVIITDTSGRAWRGGQTDIAIGSAGVRVLDDLRGTHDAHGRAILVTAPAAGDELAGAADLVKGKTSQRPVAVIRGMAHLLRHDDGSARELLRPIEEDLFHTGSQESWDAGYAAGYAAAVAALAQAPEHAQAGAPVARG